MTEARFWYLLENGEVSKTVLPLSEIRASWPAVTQVCLEGTKEWVTIESLLEVQTSGAPVQIRATELDDAPMENRATELDDAPMENRATELDDASLENRATELDDASLENRATELDDSSPAKPRSIVSNLPDELRAPSDRESLKAGQRVDGFSVQGVLSPRGHSGEAEIYLVEQAGRLHVLKLYNPGVEPSAEIIRKLSEDLKHPTIVYVERFGHHVNGGGKRFYEIQPYAARGPLSKYIPISDEAEFREIVQDLNEALHILHLDHVRIIHRDIKPLNILCKGSKGRGPYMLADFGLCLVLPDGISMGKATKEHATSGYASREQLRGEYGSATDYYSLGISLLEIFTGKFPFEGMSRGEMRDRTIQGTIPIPDNLPRDISRLIAGLTHQDLDHRWGYREVADWLEGTSSMTSGLALDDIVLPPLMLEPDQSDGDQIITIRTPAQFADYMRENPRKGQAFLYRGKLAQWLASSNKTIQRSVDIEEIVSQAERERDRDAGFYRVMYSLKRSMRYRTIGNRDCLDDREIGDYIEDEAKNYYPALAERPNHELYIYLEMRGGTTANELVKLCRKIMVQDKGRPLRIFNRILLLLQGDSSRSGFRLRGETRLVDPREIMDLSEELRRLAVRQMLKQDSKISLWLENDTAIAPLTAAWRKAVDATAQGDDNTTLALETLPFALLPDHPLVLEGREIRTFPEFESWFAEIEKSPNLLEKYIG